MAPPPALLLLLLLTSPFVARGQPLYASVTRGPGGEEIVVNKGEPLVVPNPASRVDPLDGVNPVSRATHAVQELEAQEEHVYDQINYGAGAVAGGEAGLGSAKAVDLGAQYGFGASVDGEHGAVVDLPQQAEQGQETAEAHRSEPQSKGWHGLDRSQGEDAPHHFDTNLPPFEPVNRMAATLEELEEQEKVMGKAYWGVNIQNDEEGVAVEKPSLGEVAGKGQGMDMGFRSAKAVDLGAILGGEASADGEHGAVVDLPQQAEQGQETAEAHRPEPQSKGWHGLDRSQGEDAPHHFDTNLPPFEPVNRMAATLEELEEQERVMGKAYWGVNIQGGDEEGASVEKPSLGEGVGKGQGMDLGLGASRVAEIDVQPEVSAVGEPATVAAVEANGAAVNYTAIEVSVARGVESVEKGRLGPEAWLLAMGGVLVGMALCALIMFVVNMRQRRMEGLQYVAMRKPDVEI